MLAFFTGNAASIVDCNDRGEVKLQLLSPPNVGFHYELSFFKSGNTSVSSKEGKVNEVEYKIKSYQRLID